MAGVRALSRNGFWGMLDAASGRKVSVILHAPRRRRFHLCCSAAAVVGAAAEAISTWTPLAALRARCAPMQWVGKDKFGNTYWEISNPGRRPDPRREIDYAEKNLAPAPPALRPVHPASRCALGPALARRGRPDPARAGVAHCPAVTARAPRFRRR